MCSDFNSLFARVHLADYCRAGYVAANNYKVPKDQTRILNFYINRLSIK